MSDLLILTGIVGGWGLVIWAVVAWLDRDFRRQFSALSDEERFAFESIMYHVDHDE